jgi:hypothetical protein
MEWQYRKVDLGDLPHRTNDIDLLNAFGTDGWELVVVISNNIAYLKRPREPAKRPTQRQISPRRQDQAGAG